MIKNESGRSMVEMLGVLAIIGVLSVGGIAGYTTAMKKYRQNEFTNAVSMVLIKAKTASAAKNYVSDVASALPSALSSISNITVTDAGVVTVTCASGKKADYIADARKPDGVTGTWPANCN